MNDRKREVLAKIKRLHVSKRNSLNFQLNGNRISGILMSDITFDEEFIKFKYRNKKYIVTINNITKMRRLRVRKWLFIVETKEYLEEVKKEVIAKKEINKSKKAVKEENQAKKAK